jgi:hypothetical protein
MAETDRRWTDADREAVKMVIGDCRYDDGSDEQAAAVLNALVDRRGWRPPIRHGDPDMLAAVYGYELGQADAAAHDARVRAQAGEDIARYFDGWAAAAGAVHLDAMVESWQEAARLARQVTGASGEAVDGG